MIQVAIIEDEKPALNNLVSLLSVITMDVEVTVTLQSIEESIAYFSGDPKVDLILSDVQLGDGLSFEIFRKSSIRIPVIFITAYDEFMLRAFAYNGIDFLLKPVEATNLLKALDKYRTLKKHFTDYQSISNVVEYITAQKRKRIIVKKGSEHIPLKLEDVVIFYTEHKIVYVIDKGNKKYIVDSNLTELEEDLDPAIFFRANRQYIISVHFVQGYKTFERVKLEVDMILPDLQHTIIISQEMAAQFKEWIQST